MIFRSYAVFLLRFRWLILALIIGGTVFLGSALPHLSIDPSMECFFEKKSEDYRRYQDYRAKFGSDQMISVAMSTEDIFTLAQLEHLEKVTRDLQKIEGVDRVVSLANVQDFKRKLFGIKLVQPLEDFRRVSLTELRQTILGNELFRQNLISEDGKVANILIFLKPGMARSDTVGDLRRILDQEKKGAQFYMAGSPVEQYDFIRLIRRDQMVFVPLITIFLIASTWWIYRSFVCMLASMAVVAITLVWTLGSMAVWGDALNLMTSLLPPVIMIITVVNSIHILNVFYELRTRNRNIPICIQRTLEHLGAPCFLAQFTIVLGFCSLMSSPVPAIRSFGAYAALGTVYAFFVVLTLIPILLPFLPVKRLGESSVARYFLNYWVVMFLEHLEFKWKWPIVFLTVGFLGYFGVGMQKIVVDSNLVKQMKPELPLAISTTFIDDHLTGVYSIGFVLSRKDGRAIADPKSLRQIDDFKLYLESLPNVTKVNSLTSVVKRIDQVLEDQPASKQFPSDVKHLRRIFDGLAKSDSPELWSLVSHDFRDVRLDTRIKAVGTEAGTLIDERAKAYADEHLSKDFKVMQTGNVVLLGRMAKGLVEQQVKSFGTAFLSILILICIIFKSVRMGIFAAVPNLFPVVVVYGVMGYLGIELSTTTAMISSIVIGLVVDASIHFLYRFRIEFHSRRHYLGALHNTFRTVSPALILSTSILGVGFLTSAFGNFLPTLYFGLLTSLSLGLSLISALVILPVLLVIFKPFGKQKLFVPSKDRYRAAVHRPSDEGTGDSVSVGSAGEWT